MSKRILPVHWLVILAVFLGAPALACSLITGEQPEATPAVVEGGVEGQDDGVAVPPDDEPGAGDDGAEDGGPAPPPEIGSLTAALEQYNSYRVNMDMRFDASGDSDAGGALRLESARIVEPPASSVTVYFEGDLLDEADSLPEGAQLTFVELEGTTYTVLPGFGCVSGGAGEMSGGIDEFSDLLNADELVQQLDDLEYVGQETVNEQAVEHYRFTEENLVDADQDLRDVSGDLYLSREDNYVVRMVMDAVGAVDFLEQDNGQEGTVHMEYNVLDVGGSFEITAPEGCEQDGSGLPVMEGASDVATFADFTSYSVDASLDDVVAFYREEMRALGYEEGQELLMMENSAMLVFESADRPTVTVNMTAEDDGVAVILSSEALE